MSDRKFIDGIPGSQEISLGDSPDFIDIVSGVAYYRSLENTLRFIFSCFAEGKIWSLDEKIEVR